MKWIKAGEGNVPYNPAMQQWRYVPTGEPMLWEEAKRFALSENDSDKVEWLFETDILNDFLDWAFSGCLETMEVRDLKNDPKWRFDLGVFKTNKDLIDFFKSSQK